MRFVLKEQERIVSFKVEERTGEIVRVRLVMTIVKLEKVVFVFKVRNGI